MKFSLSGGLREIANDLQLYLLLKCVDVLAVDMMFVQMLKNQAQVMHVLVWAGSGKEYVINIGIAEVQAT